MKQVDSMGNIFQSHYVPAEKPYAVYALVWEGPITSIAQLIGTILVGKPDEKGGLTFEGKPVYRMPDKNMLPFRHCFIPEDMGPLETDEMFLGFEGDTMHLEDIAKVKWLDLSIGDNSSSQTDIVRNLQHSGLKVHLPKRTNFYTVICDIHSLYNGDGENCDFFLDVMEDAPLRVQFWEADGNHCTKGYIVFSKLYNQLEAWKKIGVYVDGMKMKDDKACYQKQLNELWQMTMTFGCYVEDDGDVNIYSILKYYNMLDTDRCTYNDFMKAVKEVWVSPEKADRQLQWAIDKGLVTREGDIIHFMPVLEPMATWQWHWIDNDNRSK